MKIRFYCSLFCCLFDTILLHRKQLFWRNQRTVEKHSLRCNTFLVTAAVILEWKMTVNFRVTMTSTVSPNTLGTRLYTRLLLALLLFLHFQLSQIPTSGRTITIRFADGSRGLLNSANTELLDFILADHIRLRLVDYFTTNTTSDHRYYALKDITVAARYQTISN